MWWMKGRKWRMCLTISTTHFAAMVTPLNCGKLNGFTPQFPKTRQSFADGGPSCLSIAILQLAQNIAVSKDAWECMCKWNWAWLSYTRWYSEVYAESDENLFVIS